MRVVALGVLAGLTALIAAAAAAAHAHVSPPVVLANEGQVFTLAVPTERANATTTSVELTPPKGFAIDSFAPSPGWKRDVRQAGSGEEAQITRVTWSGSSVPAEDDAVFSFLASTSGSGSYTFAVRQTYSDGSVVEWSGPESSDSPAPVVKAVASFGGGGTPAATWVALALGALGILLGGAALLARGDRTLS